MHQSFKTRVGAAVLAGVSLGAVMVAGPAMAKPTNCTSGKSGSSTFWAACKAGSGEYRARTTCVSHPPGQVSLEVVYGVWRKTNTSLISVASCPAPATTPGGVIEYR